MEIDGYYRCFCSCCYDGYYFVAGEIYPVYYDCWKDVYIIYRPSGAEVKIYSKEFFYSKFMEY